MIVSNGYHEDTMLGEDKEMVRWLYSRPENKKLLAEFLHLRIPVWPVSNWRSAVTVLKLQASMVYIMMVRIWANSRFAFKRRIFWYKITFPYRLLYITGTAEWKSVFYR